MKTCDTCGELAVIGVTDAIETPEGWTETVNERRGCRLHPVEPNIILLDGKTMTAREYDAERHSS
jgi:hypothetical protein